MALPPIGTTSNPTQIAAQATLGKWVDPAELLNTLTNRPFVARVEKAMVVDDTIRQQMLAAREPKQQIPAGLAEKLQLTPNTSAADSSASKLYLAILSYKQSRFFSFTKELLKPGQHLQLAAIKDDKGAVALKLMDTLTTGADKATHHNRPHGRGQLHPSLLNTSQLNTSQLSPSQLSSSQPSSLQPSSSQAGAAQLSQAPLGPANSSSAAAQMLINQGMKSTLPVQQHHTQLLSFIKDLAPLLNTGSESLNPKGSALSTTLGNALHSLSSKPIESFNLDAPQLKKGVESSGVFLERKLSNILQLQAKGRGAEASQHTTFNPSTKSPTTSPTPSTPTIEVLLNDINKIPQNKFDNSIIRAQLSLWQSQLAQEDLKGTLLRLLPLLHSSAGPRLGVVQQSNLDALLSLLFEWSPGATDKTNPTRKQAQNNHVQQLLMKELGSRIDASLARIKLLQLQSLSPPNAEGSLLLTTELTVRHNDQLFPLQFFLFERWREREESQHSKKGNSTTPSKQWCVFMELMLPNQATLATEIVLIESSNKDKVRTRFWVENQEIKQKIESSLSRLREMLENKNIEVEELLLSSATKPSYQPKMTSALVDIRT